MAVKGKRRSASARVAKAMMLLGLEGKDELMVCVLDSNEKRGRAKRWGWVEREEWCVTERVRCENNRTKI